MEPQLSDDRVWWKKSAFSFLVVGGIAIVVGGLFSAATARASTYHSAWFVAYLVLVVGVAQVALGVGQQGLASRGPSARTVVAELLIFNLGNAGVVVGTVLFSPIWVVVGSALVVAALVVFARSVWSSPRRGWALRLYWVLIVGLFASVIVGLVLTLS